jgi:arabinogalactan oligomer/maltooligosaccharide transport system substrate-binding protein
MMVDGKIYGIPLSSMTDVLFYNKSHVPAPPRTMDEFLEMVNSSLKVILSPTAYHLFAWHGAFGGAWLDNSGKCIPDEGGWMKAADYLLALKESGAVYSQDFASAEAAFENGQTAFLINGPWSLLTYKTFLGQDLGAVSIPSGPLSAQPFMGLNGLYLNPNTKNPDAALELGLILSSKESQKVFMDYAGFIPVRTDVKISDPLIQAFINADRTAVLLPQTSSFRKFWSPFDVMWQKILLENAEFSEAYKEACLRMNNENNK